MKKIFQNSKGSVDSPEAAARAAIGKLDAAELEILALLVSGESSRSMAARLGTGLPEIEARRARTMEKLSATSTAEAVRIGLQAGIDE